MKGLINNGNTCYFNTAVQCLLYIPVLSNLFLRNPYDGACEFTKVYSDLVAIYWKNDKALINVKPLLESFRKKFPRFKTNEQHDVQEAVLCIIDIIENACPDIKHWFYGKKIQETIWPDGKSSNEEDFSVHIITSYGNDMGNMLLKSTDWNTLENFEDSDGKVHAIATTRMVFSKMPQIFMISFDSKSTVKIIENILIDKYEYTLISSAVHVGNQHDGHYVAFGKCKDTWFLLNDESITKHTLPEEAGYYFMVYSLKTPSSECSP
jgi:ubiquitin C-terminal hydrolase